MENLRVFEALFGKCKECTISIMTLPDKQIRHYTVEQMKKFYADAGKIGKITNTYYSVWPRRSDIPNGVRGGSEDTVYATCLFADYDVAGPAHKEKNLPPSKEVVLEHLKGLEKPPTLIIDTGYGLDPFWIFKEPVHVYDDIIRDRVFDILSGYGEHLSKLCKEQGWSLDSVFDPARMLRAPGSNNFKLESPVPCRILWESGIFYALDEFESYYKVLNEDRCEPFAEDDRTIGSAKRIMDGCLLTQKMRDDPNSVTEPEWKAICSNVVLTPDGDELFHNWSSLYNGYTFEETEYKIARSRKAKKPCSCAFVQERLGFHCPEGGCGVKAPVVLALYIKEEQFKNLMGKENLSIQEIFDPYSLNLLSYAKSKYLSEYVQFKQMLKKLGVSTRDFERALKNYVYSPPTSAEQDFEAESNLIQLEGIDPGGAMEPTGYKLSMERGVEASHFDESGIVHSCLCAEPLVITRRLENIDTGYEKVELAFFRNDRWKYLVAPRSSILNKNAIIKFADSGLPVTSDNAEGVYGICAYTKGKTPM